METQTSQSLATPKSAPTLRACQRCANSKSRCIPPTEGTDGKCARCYKAEKECIFTVKARRKRKSPTSTTAELEEKIQNLATLLISQQQAMSRSHPLTPDNQQQQTQPTSFENNHNASRHGPFPQDASPSRFMHPKNSGTHPISPQSREDVDERCSSARPTPLVVAPDISDQDAEYLLKIFRNHFSPRFPFIAIPSLSARAFRVERPWLFKAIVVVASQDRRARQERLGKELITDLSIAMVVNSEKSLDMLQALLIYNAWAFSVLPIGCLPNLGSTAHLQLSVAMVFDLGLNRTVTIPDVDAPEILKISSKTFGVPSEFIKNTTAHSLEERRTLLAVYFLVSALSWIAKRIEGFPYSPYLEYCRCSLIESAESESDLLLAALVKIQSILDKAQRSFLESAYPGGDTAPVWILSQLATLELNSYWKTLSPEIQKNDLISANYYAGQVSLFEPCLIKSYFPRDLAGGNVHRLSMLHSCVKSARKLMDHVFLQPLSAHFTFSILDITTMGLGCSALFKLPFVEEIGWDLQHLRQTVPFRDYFFRMTNNVEQVGLAIDQNQREPCSPSFFTVCAQKMQKIGRWYEVRIGSGAQSTLMTQDIHQSLPMDSIDLFNDEFWNGFFADGNLM